MPSIDYQRLRQQITIREVLELIGFQATWRRGPQLRGACPIPGCCGTSGRSFSVHLTRHVYHCFTCHCHGNALELWAVIRGVSLYQAALDLCQLLNLDLPWQPAYYLAQPTRQPSRVPFRAPSRNR
jgi:DNA primase